MQTGVSTNTLNTGIAGPPPDTLGGCQGAPRGPASCPPLAASGWRGGAPVLLGRPRPAKPTGLPPTSMTRPEKHAAGRGLIRRPPTGTAGTGREGHPSVPWASRDGLTQSRLSAPPLTLLLPNPPTGPSWGRDNSETLGVYEGEFPPTGQSPQAGSPTVNRALALNTGLANGEEKAP